MIVEGMVIGNYADIELCYTQLAGLLRRPVTTDEAIQIKTGQSKAVAYSCADVSNNDYALVDGREG